MNKIVTKTMDLNGRSLTLETGKLARQADAAVMARWGDTVVLATVATQPTKEDLGYFPLSVEFVEKYYASGRITAQKFIKREGRPSDKAVLSGRAIDRSIRPLFPKDFFNEVQVIVNVFSYDGVNDPLILGFIASSAALSISSVPFNGPIGAVRFCRKGDETMINPSLDEYEDLDLKLIVASTKTTVAMIEAEGKQVKDELVYEGIEKSHQESQKIISFIEEFAKEVGVKKAEYTPLAESLDEALLKEVKHEAKDKIEKAFFDKEHPWHDSTGDLIKEELTKKYDETLTSQQVGTIFDKVAKEIMNDLILNKGKRVDGRGMEEFRAIEAEVGLLPRAHGSALFSRGESQVMSVATLGSMAASQTLEGMEGESTKRFMHHYNMGINPFSTGEAKRISSPNRRDIGHGNLVEISLVGVLPSKDDFPYAIRVVSEVLEANASTSQASVCGSTLAMLNAGVPIEPVAGIALGLVSNGDKIQVITDMRAIEDFYGEMDFKVAGTKNGITGIQMDTKLPGISFEVVKEALRQGKAAREAILEKMAGVIAGPGKMSEFAPKIETVHIKPEQIGMLIGPGGKNINQIIADTGASIDIEDDGTVMIYSTDQAAIDKAVAAVSGQFREFKVGEEFDGKVVRLAAFGAFVELAPGKDGLVHVSQMAPGHVERPEDIVSEGQTVHVRVTDVDSVTGKIGLSMLFGSDMKPESEGRPRGGGRGFGGGGGRRDFGGGFERREGGGRRDFGRGGDRGPRRDFGGDRRDRDRGRGGRGGGGRFGR